MFLTILLWMLLAIVAVGLRSPFEPRRVVQAALGGLGVGLVLAYFNVYVGSVRGALALLGIALVVSGARFVRAYDPGSRPLHEWMPRFGVGVLVLLLLAGLFPYTAWGARTVDERLYDDLNANVVSGPAPALDAAHDVRAVPWDLASQLLVRGYGADASYLDTNPILLQRNTYPDTVDGEWLWVHAPAPETAKWLLGGRQADKVLYVRNDPVNVTPRVVEGTLDVHLDALYWQNRIGRHAMEHGELRYVTQDVALQLDDDHNPHWIAYMAHLDLRGQPHLAKLVIVNAHTGEEQVVTPDEAPDWLELVYPESYVYQWASYWGQHREGVMYRWFNAQNLVQPDDVTVRYIRLENQTYWLLPMRQLQSPQLGGYVLVNTRTGAATFYERFDEQLVDYATAVQQLRAIMASGEATRGGGLINLAISEGYLYPVRMADGSVRDAYVFPLLEGLKVSRFAIIDAQDYNNRRVFANTIGGALEAFSGLAQRGGATPPPIEPPPNEAGETATMNVLDGTFDAEKALVNLNGTHWRVTVDDLARGDRLEAQREMDELELAIARANRGDEVTIEVRFEGGRIVDVTYPGIVWGG